MHAAGTKMTGTSSAFQTYKYHSKQSYGLKIVTKLMEVCLYEIMQKIILTFSAPTFSKLQPLFLSFLINTHKFTIARNTFLLELTIKVKHVFKLLQFKTKYRQQDRLCSHINVSNHARH
jgi:hypothetical protein